MSSNNKRSVGRPKKSDKKKKTLYNDKKKHSSATKKTYDKFHYINSKNKRVIDNLQSKYDKQIQYVQNLENENGLLLNELEMNENEIDSKEIEIDNKDHDFDLKNKDNNPISKNFKTLLLCFSMRILDGT